MIKSQNKPYQETTWNYNPEALRVSSLPNKPYQETTWNYNLTLAWDI